MTKILSILIILQLLSCSGKTKNSELENSRIHKHTVSNLKKSSRQSEGISLSEQDFNKFLDSIKLFKIHPIDTLELDYNIVQLENHQIGRNRIQIFKRDSLNIDWIKINSYKDFIPINIRTQK
ncbi:hypothetical protein [Lacihabitans soyangensis]|uniref:Uncharacterized protein n=1 Tax=Lacihabitans soyangensis TaxID=869394 RepID=A0AAE3H2D4_9BACT|nr:hypothetical protein [Lacihabitans soyangensis]MCP9762761.1 hypothetical protein [Lacihabitans soyangensis]